MTKYWDPPPFSPKIFFSKMTQNGMKWILNITLKTVKFFIFDPPPQRGKISRIFFFFLMKASLRDVGTMFQRKRTSPPSLFTFSMLMEHCPMVLKVCG